MRMPVDYDNGNYRGWGFMLSPTAWHAGHDFNVALGTEVRAVLPGKVVFSGMVDGFGGMNPNKPGGMILIEHKNKNGDQFHALYGHLDRMVMDGDTVEEGQVIGRVAQFTNGGQKLPHLHFGVYIAPGYPPAPYGYVTNAMLSVWVDPRNYLKRWCQ